MSDGARRLPMFPLSTVLFPSCRLPLHVFEERYRTLVDHCLAADGRFGVVLIARGSEVGGGDQRFGVGTEAVIESARRLPDGRWLLAARGVARIEVVRWLPDDPYPVAEVADAPDGAATGPPSPAHPAAGPASPGSRSPGHPPPERAAPADHDRDRARLARCEAAVRRVRALLSELGDSPALAPGEVFGRDPEDITWGLCAAAPLGTLDRQRLLESATLERRLDLLDQSVAAVAHDLTRLLAGS